MISLIELLKEETFPDKLVGNDDIVWKKVETGKDWARYEMFWNGHNLEPGGRLYKSVDSLKGDMKNYILSIQKYEKLKHLPSKND